MHRGRPLKKLVLKLLLAFTLGTLAAPAKADFGDADFPIDMFSSGPQSYHDAWCRRINNKCRIRFQGKAMWVEGEGGIQRSQPRKFRFDVDGNEYYNYIGYESDSGAPREALFLFNNPGANREFLRAFLKWRKCVSSRYPTTVTPPAKDHRKHTAVTRALDGTTTHTTTSPLLTGQKPLSLGEELDHAS